MVIPWATQLIASLNEAHGAADAPHLSALASAYPQHLLFPWAVSSAALRASPQVMADPARGGAVRGPLRRAAVGALRGGAAGRPAGARFGRPLSLFPQKEPERSAVGYHSQLSKVFQDLERELFVLLQ